MIIEPILATHFTTSPLYCKLNTITGSTYKVLLSLGLVVNAFDSGYTNNYWIYATSSSDSGFTYSGETKTIISISGTSWTISGSTSVSGNTTINVKLYSSTTLIDTKNVDIYVNTYSYIDTTNLISYWRLESGATDSFGTNDFTTSTSVDYSSTYGKNNIGAKFLPSPTYSYLQINSNASLVVGVADFSITTWYYPLTINVYGGLFSKRILTDSSMYSLSTTGTAQIEFGIGPGGGVNTFFTTTGTTIVQNQWIFIVATRKANIMKIYLNGNYYGSANTTTTYNINNTHPVGIGRYYQTSAGQNTLNGYVDEVSFWKRELTSSEVTQLYNSGAGLFY